MSNVILSESITFWYIIFSVCMSVCKITVFTLYKVFSISALVQLQGENLSQTSQELNGICRTIVKEFCFWNCNVIALQWGWKKRHSGILHA